ncbi:isocitrate lyase/phosphoenolpyruvate mutase family protein [Jiangella aurantiaca]|uniref:Isocitrate lyase/phosphoenolpyruvate mutase family protein n=1 Tax=Jiangella aurantiaca TaxID=2530373 RepID=A0A4R5A2V6_9ACTN|nr:isocitrate lyase/phosphoenolpyruvate mutase family protein [Jiangella aurantiaca]TDD65795.1 isocitrate lyase/phosphoenolpyruvate mutase family protein [Jiangella aurantiaca]
MTTLPDTAELFGSLHRPGSPLLLPNAWDPLSARLVEAAGASAVATTSAGVAWALGTADGDHIDRDSVLALTRRIVAAVSVPVTADVESGFGANPDEVSVTVDGVLAAGAVGVNIEDVHPDDPSALRDPRAQAERLAAARAAADAAGVPFFVNARIDTYLRSVGDPADRFADTVARARAYLAAGASGIFVPGVVDLPTVTRLAAEIDGPLNVLAGPSAPPVAELAAAGVARISLGSSVASAAYAVAQRAARELFADGTYTSLEGGLAYGELNALMS